MRRAIRTHLGKGAGNPLAPARGHDETDHQNSKADQDVPVLQIDGSERTQGIACAGNVINQNPQQPDNHEAKHQDFVPGRVLFLLTHAANCIDL